MGEIIEGDCRATLRKMGRNSVDLVVTSPPYNVGVEYESYSDDLSQADYKMLIKGTFDHLNRVVKDSGRVCVNVSLKNDNGVVDTPSMIKEKADLYNWDLRFEIIWNKGNSESSSAWGSWRSPSSPRPIFNHEYIFIFDVGDGKMESEKTIEKDRFMQLVKSVWDVKPETVSDHPASFPPEIPRRLIELNSYEGDTVLDPFAGSGTTLAVAEDMGREYIGIEIEEKYIEMAEQRVLEYERDTENKQGLFNY